MTSAAAKRRPSAKKSKAKTKAKRKPANKAAQYERRKERERERQAQQSAEGRNIANDMPKCADAAARRKCDRSLKYFALECFADKFKKDFSPDHETAIRKMESSIVDGLRFALSMPRGSGKTTLIIVAVIWAIVTGRRRYIALIGPTAKHAKGMLRTIKKNFECNERLYELYPEACHPVRRLEGIVNRCRGQLHNGERTHIEWTKTQVVLATIPRAKCSGAIIETAGMTGSIRGMQFESPTGETLRPDCFVVDDPQTKRSAKSETQCDDRMETIQGDILGLAGPGESIAGFLMCTVIRKGDVADQLLDQTVYPDWQGERFKLVYEWPDESSQPLWDEYAIILSEELAAGKKPTKANAFFKKNQRKMTRGCRVGWAARYDEKRGELHAMQHAMNLLLRDEEAFWCEYQNEPRDPHEDVDLLTVDELIAKQSGYQRGVVHPDADTLTAFIDVQGKCLYWCVIAWRSTDFSGWIVDYGAWPDQGVSTFKLASVRKTLAKKYPNAGLEGRVKQGAIDLIDYLVKRKFYGPKVKGTKAVHTVRRVGIDIAWGEVNQVLKDVCRTHEHAALVIGAYGRGIKPGQTPMAEWAKVEGERKGVHWIVRRSDGGGRHLLSDVNFWKSFVHHRFSTADGDRGSLYLPKPSRNRKNEHKMLAEHQRAEKRIHKTVDGGQHGDVWETFTNKPDNHLFDCVVHCAVLASIEGVQLAEHGKTKKRRKKKKRGYAGALAAA